MHTAAMEKNKCLAFIKDLLDIERENQIIMLVYLGMISAAAALYISAVPLRMEGYHPELYSRGYMYFALFSFLLFSVLLPFWETEGGREGMKGVKLCFQAATFTFSQLPLMLAIFVMGKLEGVNFAIPLAIQTSWGMALLAVKDLLKALKIDERWRGLTLAVFIFTVLIVVPVLTYLYIEYNQTVITTVFDRRIPWQFFLSPALAQAGILNAQSGGSVQQGYMPFMQCIVFWAAVSSVAFIWAAKTRQKE